MKLSSALPEGIDNGLTAILRDVITDPEKDYLIVGIVTGHKLTTDVESGDVVPTVKIVQIEAITDDAEGTVVQRALSKARAKRTGQLSIDTTTGEIDGAA